ncbi:Multiple sugar ABC transporter, membrane-spanning permease protein MsmG [Pediococcus damnosus]|uniref:Multiple sugar ABC transporter, membrane-spanning permease protein MsmG n=1 Tax=Pediococcus damnosus TaxID=51663 RepID=A0ABN4N9M9_9LACO|nr:hypothetical protein [Pediococcus damnosus]AMV67360.1 Multiple sugar ABC transporter, membrane-spanning permease protein MsmG [Pediococcus damnosus]
MQANVEVKSNEPKPKKRAKNKHINWTLTSVLMVVAIFAILGPIYITIVIALKDPSQMTNILSLPKKIHWENFANAWSMTDFPRMFFNTLFITVVNIIFTILTNSMAAYVITRYRLKNKFFNMMYYYFISAMFIPFNVIMLPLVKEVSAFHMDNILGITFLYIVFVKGTRKM